MSASINASSAFGRPLFELGSICMTEGVCDLVGNGLLRPAPLVLRHVSGDWGEMDAEDCATNNRAVKHGGRIMSSYQINATTRICIITEWGRSVTTVLRPSED